MLNLPLVIATESRHYNITHILTNSEIDEYGLVFLAVTCTSRRGVWSRCGEHRGGESVMTIKLGPVMDLVAATALKDDILELAGAPGGVTIDAAEVETLTTPCLQIIVAAGLLIAERGQEFSILNVTDAARAAFEDLGLGPELQRWSNAK